MEYLDFELPIKDLEEQLQKCQIIGEESEVDVTETCKQIEKKLAEAVKLELRRALRKFDKRVEGILEQYNVKTR